MLNVVLFEHHRERHTNRQIREDRKRPVGLDTAESEVVGNLVNGEERVLVGRSTDNVGEGPELPRPERSVAEVEGGAELDEGDEEDDPFRQRLVSHQLGDLRDDNTGSASS